MFLGIDVSTQGMKAVVLEDSGSSLSIAFECQLSYDVDLPHYRTCGGVHFSDDEEGVVTAPVDMWMEALDEVLHRLALKGCTMKDILVVCGSAQQHGTVYWRSAPACSSFPSVICLANSPTWMDSSSTMECKEFTEAFGGPMECAMATGSSPTERFSGPQIAKVIRRDPLVYHRTQHVSLVSSFMASLFLGCAAPMDFADASGMNLLDIRTRDWNVTALRATLGPLMDDSTMSRGNKEAEGESDGHEDLVCHVDGPIDCLKRKLGVPIASHSIVGRVCSDVCERHGFSQSALVAAFSGDNPCTLVGLQLFRPGQIAISLGTSDTLMASMSKVTPKLDGHVLCSPLSEKEFMSLLCFKNGACARKYVRDGCAHGEWSLFSKLLDSTPPGNNGNIGMYYIEPEILPLGVRGIYRFDDEGERVHMFPPDVEVRAVVESQCLSMRYHAAQMGLNHPVSILATGGASINASILQVLSNVFGVSVFVGSTPNSAALGAAYRAYHAYAQLDEDGAQGSHHFIPFDKLLDGKVEGFTLAAEPDVHAHNTYKRMLRTYEMAKDRVMEEFSRST